MSFHDLNRFHGPSYQVVGARGRVEQFFLGQPGQTDLPVAAKLGAPLIPIGIGGVALSVILKKPAFAPLGVLAALLGVSLLTLRNYYEDKELARAGIP
jgi:hypothetical protein